MTLEEILYDIKEIYGAIEDDSDLSDPWLAYKINNYRAVMIPEQYRLDPTINPSWLQRSGKFQFTKTDAADDPAITVNSITIGRAEIPSVIALPDDMGIYRITGSGGIIGFEPTDLDSLIMKALIKEDIPRNFGYYARINTYLYVYPYIMEGAGIFIPEDPTSMQVHDDSGYRDYLITDPYPIDAKMAQAIALQILTVDLKLAQQAISDIINDSQDELKIMKDAVTPKKD